MSGTEKTTVKASLSLTETKYAESPISAMFKEKLQESADSTSTPYCPKTRSTTDLDLGSKQDSGFAEISSLTYSQDSLIDLERSKHENHDSVQREKIIKRSDSIQNSSTQSVQGTQSQHELGLERMHVYLKSLNSSIPLHLRIGRRIGDEYVDIIPELHSRQIPALSVIFGLLSDADLLRCLEVSKSWKSVMYSDDNTKQRIRCLNKITKHHDKENQCSTKDGVPPITSGMPLSSIQVRDPNISPSSSSSSSPEPVTTDSVIFNRFAKAARKLKTGEQFVKCPRCMGPAKLYREARQGLCVTRSCQYNYCTLCELVFHGDEECAIQPNRKIRITSQPISSKQSKKHLRRL